MSVEVVLEGTAEEIQVSTDGEGTGPPPQVRGGGPPVTRVPPGTWTTV